MSGVKRKRRELWESLLKSEITALSRLRNIHRPFAIYDACMHSHTEGEPGVIAVDDVGLVCGAGKMYDICTSCCVAGDGQAEWCASGHDHGPDKPVCVTAKVLDEEYDMPPPDETPDLDALMDRATRGGFQDDANAVIVALIRETRLALTARDNWRQYGEIQRARARDAQRDRDAANLRAQAATRKLHDIHKLLGETL